jgi:cytochrome c oxidase subunit 3
MFNSFFFFNNINNSDKSLNLKSNFLKKRNVYKSSTKREQTHPFHLVDPSPWPLLGSLSSFALLGGVVYYAHFFINGFDRAFVALILVTIGAIIWWRDVVRESTFEGLHTAYVLAGLKAGMVLFIVSEVMLFFAFFWAYFHSCLNPTIELGCTWPPIGIIPMNPWGIPLLNTIILLTSGATVTWAHYGVIGGLRRQIIGGFLFTIILAAIFTGFQGYEYVHATFTISDSSYGSTFYMATGLHGFHVLVGTIFLAVCFGRHISYHFTRSHHIGFECAIWYWHFVDVVWIFLFITIYWWGHGYPTDPASYADQILKFL